MYTNRRAFSLLAIPFGAVTLATLLLFFLADQTLDALSMAVRVSDLWMEADRTGALQIERCLDWGGVECDLLPVRLKRPLAYVRATQERAKENPDLQVMRQALAEAGVENRSLLRFRMRWFERVSRFVGLAARNADEKAQQTARLKGAYTPDIQHLMDLNVRAKEARARQPVDALELSTLRKELSAFRAQLEDGKSEFDRRASAASDRLRQVLYLIVVSCVLGMFGIATWVSQRILQRWEVKEQGFRARDRELSRALQLRVEELQKAVSEKGVLLRELQHRVKNNLQVISSLSSLQARQVDHGAARQALITIQDRVKSLAIVHDSLCFPNSLAEVDFARYIHGLAPPLIASYSPGSDAIRLQIEVNAIVGLDDATPCALILNELLSNALKYAFAGRTHGTVWIRFVEEDQEFLLEVRDDGVGMAPDYSIERANALGLQLVTELAAQLHGMFTWVNDGGAVFRVQFSRRRAGRAGQEVSELAAKIGVG